MRLSDAIATGRMLLRPEQQGGDGEKTGCVLQMALAAMSLDATSWELAAEEWPWLTDKLFADKDGAVHQFYDALIDVFDGEYGIYNIDQLIDWVRSIEPPEPDELVLSQGPQRGVSASPMSESPSQEVWICSTTALDVAQDPDRHGECEEVA